MPVKRRASKQRLSPAAQLEAWETTFQCGCDFFGDLKQLGVVHPRDFLMPADREKATPAFMAAAEAAWKELGAAFLAAWEPNGAREISWGEEQFGEPN